MRICEKHHNRAVETLFSKKTGTEYDLCAICEVELDEILNGSTSESEFTPEGKAKIIETLKDVEKKKLRKGVKRGKKLNN